MDAFTKAMSTSFGLALFSSMMFHREMKLKADDLYDDNMGRRATRLSEKISYVSGEENALYDAFRTSLYAYALTFEGYDELSIAESVRAGSKVLTAMNSEQHIIQNALDNDDEMSERLRRLMWNYMYYGNVLMHTNPMLID